MATTKYNIAHLERDSAAFATIDQKHAHLNAGLAEVDDALSVFDPEHTPSHHTKVIKLRAELQAALDALR